MDQASLHAQLLSQSDATFERGLRYYERADGWEAWPCEGGREAAFIIAEDDYVGKYSATVNKAPLDAIRHLRENRDGIFERNQALHAGTTYHHRFEDHSFLAEDKNRSPDFGEFSVYKYVRVKKDGDNYWLVGSSPIGDAYPRGPLWHDFEIIKFQPVEGGTRITCVSRGEMAYQLSVELKRQYVPTWIKYYFGIADEINAA
jgi:hypothetical protein